MINNKLLRIFKHFSSSLIPVGSVKTASAINIKLKNKENSENESINDILTYYTTDGKLNFLKYDSRGLPKIGDTLYETFGVSEEANIRKIKEHYFLIVKNYHPDINQEYLVSL